MVTHSTRALEIRGMGGVVVLVAESKKSHPQAGGKAGPKKLEPEPPRTRLRLDFIPGEFPISLVRSVGVFHLQEGCRRFLTTSRAGTEVM